MTSKIVSQLDAQGYFVGATEADESPLEPGVYLLPARTVDVSPPDIPVGKQAKWLNGWVFEDVPPPVEPLTISQTPPVPTEPPTEPAVEPEMTYADRRRAEYPDFYEYVDGIVKGDTAQVQSYIDACLAVKAKYPKPE